MKDNMGSPEILSVVPEGARESGVRIPQKEYPILFSALMVPRLLADLKFVTRRLSKQWLKVKAGDRLWVRETWWEIPEPSRRQLRDGADTWPKVAYDVDENEVTREQNRESGWRRRPSIFMFRKFSRILLDCEEDARLERLQDITEEEAIAEGLLIQMGGGTAGGPGYKWNGPGYHDFVNIGTFGPTFHVATGRHGKYCSCRDGEPLKLTPARCAFRCLWQSLHAKPGKRWEDNPEVVRVGRFKRIANSRTPVPRTSGQTGDRILGLSEKCSF